jgi:murein DD-endopeptidase MepM/ murein hydrolase activator NlpD
VPVGLRAAVLALAASLGLATVAPPTSSGALQPVAARVAAGTGSTATTEPMAASGAVAGISSRTSSGGPRDRHAIRLLPIAPTQPSGYRWPLLHARVTLPFGAWHGASRIVDGQAFHDGVDLATFCGDRIGAAHDGVVVAAGRHYDSQMGWVGDLGPYFERLDAMSLWTTLPIVVVIDDGNGYRSIYAHFSKIVVKRGDVVHAGQLLGNEGRTGRASGCHLHFGLYSPEESARFGIDPKVAAHMKLPVWEIARVDPLLVLPARVTPPPAPDPGANLGDGGY